MGDTLVKTVQNRQYIDNVSDYDSELHRISKSVCHKLDLGPISLSGAQQHTTLVTAATLKLQDKTEGNFKAYMQNNNGQYRTEIYVVPPQSWGDRSDTKHSKCLLLGGRRLNQLTLIPKPKGSGGARAATAQVGPANNRNDTKRCLPIEASLRPGEAIPW